MRHLPLQISAGLDFHHGIPLRGKSAGIWGFLLVNTREAQDLRSPSWYS